MSWRVMAIVKFNNFVNRGVIFVYAESSDDGRMALYKYLKPKYEVQGIKNKPINTKEHCIKRMKRALLVSIWQKKRFWW